MIALMPGRLGTVRGVRGDQLLEAVRTHVSDYGARQQIQRRFNELIEAKGIPLQESKSAT
jgi:hypothetical protein